MIKGFRSKPLKLLWQDNDSSKLPAESLNKIRHMLAVLDQVNKVPEDLAVFMGWKLHPLKGMLNGYWSLTVSGNRRIVFRFENGHVFDVNYVDYH